MIRRAGLAGLAASCVVLLAPACSEPPEGGGTTAVGSSTTGCPLRPDGALALATSRRAHSVPTLPPRVRGLVVEFLRGVPVPKPGEPPAPPLVLVNVDGAPVVHWRKSFSSSGKTDIARDYDRQEFLTLFDSALRDMRAAAPEVDDLEGLAVAARAVTASGLSAIVLADSGLSTLGFLNFAEPGVLDATPEDVVARLQANDALPDLSELTVFLALGETAAPQDPLGIHYRKQIYAIWEAVVKAAGAACVASLDDSGPAVPPLTSVPPVTKVRIPGPPDPPEDCRVVLADAGAVAFQEGTADFVDEPAAKGQLRKIGEALRAQGCGTLMLTGTTAHWMKRDLGYHLILSSDRAEKVRDELDAYVPADRLRTRGVGYQFKQYVPDNDARGLLPGPAQLNRTVRIDPCTPDCPPA